MPEYLDVEPDQLRRIAQQHDTTAANIRKWGEIPRDWLTEFPSKYGTIADPVRGALEDYYQRRHDNAERLAARHERTRDDLIAAAKALEDGDQSGKHTIGRAGGGFDGNAPADGPAPGASTNPVRKADPPSDPPIVQSAQPERHPATTSDAPDLPPQTGRFDEVPPQPAASAPHNNDAAPSGFTPHNPAVLTGVTPLAVDTPESGADISHTPADDTSSAVSTGGYTDNAAGRSIGTDGAASWGSGEMPAPMTPGTFPTALAGTSSSMPPSLAPGPLTSAAHVAEDRQALPSFVVGEQIGDDLLLARNLLAATLTAVADSARGVEWAVAVGRTPIGPVVMLTSTEGRGWLPPGLFLPSEVALPWNWDSVLDTEVRRTIAALEGTTDPARILAEFGVMMRRRGVRLRALVSSATISDELRAALGVDVAVEDRVTAAESAVDLTSPGVGLVDRLTLGGSGESLQEATTVSEKQIRARCIELAKAADAQVRAALSGVGAEVSAHRVGRQQILDALQAGFPIPASWWEELRTVDDRAAEVLQARRVNVSHVPLGGIFVDAFGTDDVREMVFERRADELLLLLASGEPDRQTLRDALYSYDQIIEHPSFPAVARAVATPATAVPDVEIARRVEPPIHGVGFVSVDSARLGGASPFLGELLTGPAESEGSIEQRRS
ncbi:type VII secretion target [Nocardia sp. NPDC051900]|uniref:type VII secretion target n=1 Tax=Nocardia sp. NPDC051900 TaxID=3364326 RepID=UPI0037B2062B